MNADKEDVEQCCKVATLTIVAVILFAVLLEVVRWLF